MQTILTQNLHITTIAYGKGLYVMLAIIYMDVYIATTVVHLVKHSTYRNQMYRDYKICIIVFNVNDDNRLDTHNNVF